MTPELWYMPNLYMTIVLCEPLTPNESQRFSSRIPRYKSEYVCYYLSRTDSLEYNITRFRLTMLLTFDSSE